MNGIPRIECMARPQSMLEKPVLLPVDRNNELRRWPSVFANSEHYSQRIQLQKLDRFYFLIVTDACTRSHSRSKYM